MNTARKVCKRFVFSPLALGERMARTNPARKGKLMMCNSC